MPTKPTCYVWDQLLASIIATAASGKENDTMALYLYGLAETAKKL
ncbi:MAG: hypothetical protein RBT61_00345 [Candidatus Kapabacteria bacterium]|jgi:hypothetical protein|nr:hypothetical protein [Candidatus Kapabacteria bacterium]